MSDKKGQLVEKLIFAIMPILFSCVIYLMMSLKSLNDDVINLNSKMSLVVTSDNKQASNSGAELAREKLRQDLEHEIQENRNMILQNRQDIAVIETKMKKDK